MRAVLKIFTSPDLNNKPIDPVRLLRAFLWAIIAIVSLEELAFCFVASENCVRWLTIAGSIDLVCLSLFPLIKKGRLRLAGTILVALTTGMTSALAFTAGGLRSMAVQYFPVVILMTGLVLGRRACVIVGSFYAVIGSILATLDLTGNLPLSSVEYSSIFLWITLVILIAMYLLMQRIGDKSVEHALGKATSELERRKKTEEALRASEEFRKRVFDTSNMPIVVSDPKTLQFLDCNPAAARIFRHASVEETLTKTPLDVSAPVQYDGTPTLEQAKYYADRAIKEGSIKFEWKHQRPDGEIWDAEVFMISFKAGNRQLVQFTLIDITERKKSEQRIELQAALLNASHDAILVWNVSGGIQFMNPAAEELTGQRLTECEGAELKTVLHSQSEVELDAALYQTTHSGSWSGELTLQSDDEPERVVASRWTMAPLDPELPPSILITCNDITENKRLENLYLRAQRLESIGTLASGIAHDLNNVLSPIIMGVELLGMNTKDSEDQNSLTVMKESAHRGAETIRQLLTFARGTDPVKGPLQTQQILKEIGRLLQQTFPKNIQIYSDCADQPITVLADPSQLHQMLMNLCVNARDAMPEGGVLFLRLEETELSEEQAGIHPNARPISYAVFEVADSGCGIPAKILDRIFDPFFTTKPQGKGSGLGLATTLGIIEGHEGFVLVNSEADRGTRFRVYLPSVSSGELRAAAPEAHQITKGQGELVLVVDDEDPIIRMASGILTRHGYTCITANNASEALNLYEQHREQIQLVLTDIMMPFGDGKQLTTILREQNPALPVVAMSGLSTSEFKSEIIKSGASAFVSKPFESEQLLGPISHLLNRA